MKQNNFSLETFELVLTKQKKMYQLLLLSFIAPPNYNSFNRIDKRKLFVRIVSKRILPWLFQLILASVCIYIFFKAISFHLIWRVGSLQIPFLFFSNVETAPSKNEKGKHSMVDSSERDFLSIISISHGKGLRYYSFSHSCPCFP